MRFIVDTNILISALIRDSKTRFLLTHLNAELFSVGFSKIEFAKHKNEIIKKAKVNEEELEMIMENIHSRLIMIKDEIIELRMEEAKKIMDKIDSKDTIFIAAALATNSVIWSDDKHFKKQNMVKVITTTELLNLTQLL